LDPEVVILGGGITQAGAALFSPLRVFLNRFEWRPGGARARIVRAKLGDRAGSFGAAWQAIQANSKPVL
jgi:glucokinase